MSKPKEPVERSNEDKVLFPDSGITKGEIIDYYAKVGDELLHHASSRPLTFKRCPDGIDDCFFQKHSADYFPDWLKTVSVETHDGEISQVVANQDRDLDYLCNLGCIEFHAPLAPGDSPHRPDLIVFDLDPSGNDFETVKRAAHVLREHLNGLGLNALLKTTGSRGVHVVIPIHPEHDFDAVREWATGEARKLAAANDDWLTTEIRKNKRGDRLFLDTARNAYGQTVVLPYSVRAIESAPVATPIDWDELAQLQSARDYTIESIPRRLGQRKDPWHDIARHRQHLTHT